jgi:acyl-CoA oxidase
MQSLQSEMKEGDLSKLAETHATSAGLKSFVTQVTADGIEECRRCCGGHGYSRFSGLPDLFEDYLPLQTAEGDNYLLAQQTARYLLKALSTAQNEPSKLAENVGYLSVVTTTLNTEKCSATSPNSFLCPHTQMKAMDHRTARLISTVGQKIQQEMQQGKTLDQTWNDNLLEIVAISKAHCIRTVHRNFVNELTRIERDESGTPSTLYPVLKNLCDLFANYWLEKEMLSDLLSDNYLNGEQVNFIKTQVRLLLKKLRPESIGLVDSFNFTDYDLNSALGRYDGHVYEALYDWAQKEPLNKQDVLPFFHKSLGQLIKSGKPQSNL